MDRAEHWLDSPEDTANHLTFGIIHGMIRGEIFPKEAASPGHWVDILGTSGLVAGGTVTKQLIKSPKKLLQAPKVKPKEAGKGGSGNWEAQKPMFGEDWDTHFRSKYGEENVTWETNGKSKNSSGNRVATSKPPIQVGYGETDLSSMAKKYRIENQIYDLRNLVVAEIEIDGVRTLKVFESTKRKVVKPNGRVEVKNVHSEMVLLEDKISAEKNGQTYIAHRVYTEREPCSLPGHECKVLLSKDFPDAEVTYSVEYGDTKASRDRGNADLAKELEKLKE